MHEPVLVKEISELLNPKSGDVFFDGTANGGGHMRAILPRIGSSGKYIAVEWDKELAKKLKEDTTEEKNVFVINDNYKNIPMILKSQNLAGANCALLDLGFSSFHTDQSGRGFSFQKNEPLKMTYSENEKPVSKLLERLSEKKLAEIIREYGEERYADRIAHAIKHSLPIKTTKELASAVQEVFRSRSRIHPATRTFQALRIFANQELQNLAYFLSVLPQVLKEGGRVAIISFHSLEDRIVKNEFKALEKSGRFKVITKKPVTPGRVEVKANPRSRSAKLRVLSKIESNFSHKTLPSTQYQA